MLAVHEVGSDLCWRKHKTIKKLGALKWQPLKVTDLVGVWFNYFFFVSKLVGSKLVLILTPPSSQGVLQGFTNNLP